MFTLSDHSANDASAYEFLTNQGSDMPFPGEDEVRQLGHNILTEILDTFGKDATESHAQMIANCVIGGIHSALMRIERETDFAADELKALTRDQDGSEIRGGQIDEALAKVRFGEAMQTVIETFRDAAADTYYVTTNELWKPYRGSAKSHTTTYAMMEASEVLKRRETLKSKGAEANAQTVVFRGSTDAKTKLDQEVIFSWLDRAQDRYPLMQLACTGNNGAEQIAMKWAKAKNITTVVAGMNKGDGRAAPFKCNDRLLNLKPVLVLTLSKSLEAAASTEGSGIVLNISQKAAERKFATYELAKPASASRKEAA